MNPEYEKQLADRVRQELDTLGELSAPSALARRIMQTIAARAARPWYRQAWQNWPLGWRLASLTVLLAGFTGLCLGAWHWSGGLGVSSFSGLFAGLAALWRAVSVLANVGANFIRHIDPRILMAAAVMIFATAVAGIGLGSVYVRLALRLGISKN